MKIHVLGIGGTGMIGIAELAIEMGYTITGTDIKKNEAIISLEKKGGKVYTEHSKSNISDDISVVVRSSAIKEDNIEIQEAKTKRIPVWNRMYTLNRLLSHIDTVVSVVGSCGKTSMVSILEYIFQKKNPTVYMGAKSKLTNQFGKVGNKKLAICECCEYKGAFLEFQATHAVLTSIIKNHEDYYGNDTRSTIKVMNNFFELSGVRTVFMPYELKNEFIKLSNRYKIITIGEKRGDYQYTNIAYNDGVTSFEVIKDGKIFGKFSTNLFGQQYIKELILGIAIAHNLKLSINDIKTSIARIKLPDRRMQIEYNSDHIMFINDNARIPKQIQTSLQGLQEAFPFSAVICIAGIWGRINARPLNEFAEILKNTQAVFLLPLGDCAISQGGAEPDDTIEQLEEKLNPFCIPIYKNIEVADILNEIKKTKMRFHKRKIIIAAFGYDKYNMTFHNLFTQLKEYIT